jgi:hypothetical protein
MSVHVPCPGCQRCVIAPDGYSGELKCVSCAHVFAVHLPPAAPTATHAPAPLPAPGPQRVVIQGMWIIQFAAWTFVVLTLVETAMFLFFLLRSFRGF